MAIFLLCMPVIASPVEAIAVLGFVLAGVPVFYLTQMTEDEQPRVFGTHPPTHIYTPLTNLYYLPHPPSSMDDTSRTEDPESLTWWDACVE